MRAPSGVAEPAPASPPVGPAGRRPGAAGERREGFRARRAAVAVAALNARLVRRGAALLALAVGSYVAVELVSYLATYPDAASRQRLAAFQDNPALRMLQGIPHAVDTPGGFVMWDGGWILAVILGLWGLLTASRLLRGEEDAYRIETVLAGPVPATRVVRVQLAVIGVALGLAGLVIAAVLVGWGCGVAGSLLFGAGLTGFAATQAGTAAVLAQVVGVRRRVIGISTMLFGLGFVLRMAANSADSRGWLRRLTPFGWLDQLHPFADNRWPALAPLLLAPLVLAAVAVALRSRRDTGGALLSGADRRRANLRMLGSPLGIAWRTSRGVLTGWLVGLSVYCFMIGTLVRAVVDFLTGDPSYERVLRAFGMDTAQVGRSYAGVMGVLTGLVVALYACWRIGAARGEEAGGLLEHLLTRPVPRWRWLGGHALLAAGSAAVLSLAASVSLWLGSALTGGPLEAGDTVPMALNALPVTVLFGGLAILSFGVAPRLTVGLSVGTASLAYLIELIGPALKWPAWVLDASPFHHVAPVPAEPFALLPAAVLVAAGLAAALAGMAAFNRRDLTGA
jgi:ABC-2 type transport system permease protein